MIGGLEGGREPNGVALELLDDRQQVMRDRRRLRRLGVGVRAVDRFRVTPGQRDAARRAGPASLRRVPRGLPLQHAVHRHRQVVAAARGMQPAGDVLAAGLVDQPLDVEEQILVGAVVAHRAHLIEGDAVERVAERARVRAGNDALLGQHHEVRVVDRHQRRQQQLLRVLEIFVENVRDVFRRELHQ